MLIKCLGRAPAFLRMRWSFSNSSFASHMGCRGGGSSSISIFLRGPLRGGRPQHAAHLIPWSSDHAPPVADRDSHIVSDLTEVVLFAVLRIGHAHGGRLELLRLGGRAAASVLLLFALSVLGHACVWLRL